MFGYVLRRLLAAVPVLLGLTLIAFGIMAAIPGDPATAILGSYAVSYTHLTLPTMSTTCRSRWSPDH